ncbi:MAG: hypothetical protein O9327_02095 [Polaromonas sp.]|nr:hypothetical protein [Polaromonas sp.]
MFKFSISKALAVLVTAISPLVVMAQNLSPVLDAAGHTIGYKDTSTCVIWPVPSAFDIGLKMRHDKSVYDPSKAGNFRLEGVAEPYAASLRIAGQPGWRLPTVNESRSFFSAFFKATTPAGLQAQASVVGTYWTRDVTSNQAAAVRPNAAGPVTQWYSRTGVDAFVWPVLDAACGSVGVSPFGSL